MSILAIGVLASCGSNPSGSDAAGALAETDLPARIEVTSTAFGAGEVIPQRYSCDGDDISPPIAWADVPAGTARVALVVDDPDASHGTYVHWVLFALPVFVTDIAAGQVPAGARQAKNSAGDARYKGPCPPSRDGPHHYRFTVYALRTPIDARSGAPASDVLDAIRRSATARGTLVATYDR